MDLDIHCLHVLPVGFGVAGQSAATYIGMLARSIVVFVRVHHSTQQFTAQISAMIKCSSQSKNRGIVGGDGEWREGLGCVY